ncbi:MAG TPA: hypothetical protein VF474_12635 [Phenylobacterium sp.]
MDRTWARLPLMTLLSFFLTLWVVEDGVLALVTAVIGRPSHRELTVTGVQSGKQCAHFEVREVLFLADRALCAPREDLDRAEAGDQLTVFGRGSPFGLNVERYELRSGAGR